MKFKANDYKPKDVLKFIRQSTDLTQKEFAAKLKKSTNWVKSNEQGVTRFYFDDLIKIANMFDIEIIIQEKIK